jgi:hypothetical protein
MPGTFIIELHYKGRDKPILEMDLKLDDLLEKVGSQFQYQLGVFPFNPCDWSFSHVVHSNKIIFKCWIWSTYNLA